MIKQKSDLGRRLSLYGFGLVMGTILVSIITKGKACQLPGTVKLQELHHQPLVFTSDAHCKMECYHLNEQDIKTILQTGTINYNQSQVHQSPCPEYRVEGETSSKKEIQLTITDCGDTSKVMAIHQPATDCNCN